MCCLFRRTNRRQRNDRCDNSIFLCRKTPRTKRYLENDLSVLSSNNNCCSQCGCCPCCCEIAYRNDRCDSHYDSCQNDFQTYSAESFCAPKHDDYC